MSPASCFLRKYTWEGLGNVWGQPNFRLESQTCPVGLSREEKRSENNQQCFPADIFRGLAGRMTGGFSMDHGFSAKGGGNS